MRNSSRGFGGGYGMKHLLETREAKTIIALLAAELGCLLLVTYKGLGSNYLPVTLMFMFFSVAGCIIAFSFQADSILTVLVLLLLNIGFMVQQIQFGSAMGAGSFLKKFTIVIAAALAAAFLYKFLADWLSREYMIVLMMILQYLISLAMAVFAQSTGDKSGQGAAIELLGITPFEIVKVLYIFVAAGLLCKKERERMRILKWEIRREVVLILHTIFLSLFFLLCSELGTFMIVYLTGLILLWIYGKKRKLIWSLILLSATGFVLVWALCGLLLYPMMLERQLALPGTVEKLISRFGTALHPEKSIASAGYQGTMGLEAIAIGGWLGIPSERYRLELPEAANDFAFANVVQTCGLLIGFLLILFMIAFIKRGMDIANRCSDGYFQGIAASISILFVTEAVVHIGYNTALLPITGIPLYFISQGFTAIFTGMTFVAILLVISTGDMERTVE